MARALAGAATALLRGKPSPTLDAAQAELARGLEGLLGRHESYAYRPFVKG